MDSSDSPLNSTDKVIRKEYLFHVHQSTDLSHEKKIHLFKIALQDKHDSLRSLAIEYLCDEYEQLKFQIYPIFIESLKKEKIWTVKFLILKKIIKFQLDTLSNKDLILKLTYEPKPQIRMAAAEILLSYNDPEENLINRLLDLWKDKDENVRKQLELLLSDSKIPKIKEFMMEYERKLAEKEKKRKDIVGMFEGI